MPRRLPEKLSIPRMPCWVKGRFKPRRLLKASCAFCSVLIPRLNIDLLEFRKAGLLTIGREALVFLTIPLKTYI
jgi:hypothetical protein